MANRYDYPSSDDTTVDDFEPLTDDDSERVDVGDVGTVGDDTPLADYADTDGPFCVFCDRPLPEGETDYCDAICSNLADRDNREDR